MVPTDQHIHDHIDQLFRQSHGRILALLISKFGTDRLDLIESAVMTAFYKALKTWPLNQVPESPQGWLYTAARHALIDTLRKHQREAKYFDTYSSAQSYELPVELDDDSIKDPELKLLFLTCHPQLKQEDQLIFMLKTISGFGDAEISHALMLKKATVKKRLLRARSKIKEAGLAFGWPPTEELKQRLSMVHRSLYLLFNEGFYSNHPELWTRKDLCIEAMRLCKYLCVHQLASQDTYALMSLMCYHISRYESRLDEAGQVILLHEQDRSLWEPYFINLGHHFLEKSADLSDEKTKYQIEAFISAQHCLASSIEKTNWSLIKSLYEGLYKSEPQDLILLNLVVVHLYLQEVEEAKVLYHSINKETFDGNQSIYYMVGVELYTRLKDLYQTELLLEQAISSAMHPKEITLLKSKLEHLQNTRISKPE